MKFCPGCGNRISSNSVVCPYCGVQVGYMQTYERKTNGTAIAAIILSFFIPLIGLILGGIGLKKSHKLNDGRGLSIAAIVISLIQLVAVVLIIALAVVGASLA